jgi:catechol 2,3-dioxygenase-like lactoylglutathione lyase family enzyme
MFISGIQQIGVGVVNVKSAFKWYRDHFGVDVPIFEEAATAGLMLPYTGGEPRSRHAILALNLQGGGGMEIWQYTNRTPQPPSTLPLLGDLGIYAAKIKAKNAEASFHDLRKKGVTIINNPVQRPDGIPHFFVKDPWNNVFEIVQSDNWFSKGRPQITGGVYGATIGVSDMGNAMEFYHRILGFDQIVFDQTGNFADLHGVDGGFGNYRRVLLKHRETRKGPFSKLLGNAEIELLSAMDRQPEKIFKNRFWGDLGFIHLCFDITGMDEMKAHCEKNNSPFTVDSSGSFDMGEAAGYFSYIEDPDGTLIEFVETHKIPILKQFGWYLNLKNRKRPEKPLPSWLLKMLGIGRVS